MSCHADGVVRAADDLRFERHGRDLYRRETIEVVNAVLGTSIDVPTLDGKVTVKLPAGTQPDTMLRRRAVDLGAPLAHTDTVHIAKYALTPKSDAQPVVEPAARTARVITAVAN